MPKTELADLSDSGIRYQFDPRVTFVSFDKHAVAVRPNTRPKNDC